MATATTVTSTRKLLISVFLTTSALISSERVPEELIWSAKKCKELGHGDGRFDLCAEIEFCETGEFDDDGGYHRHQRQLHSGRRLLRGKRKLEGMEGREDEPIHDSTEMWPMPEEVSSMEEGEDESGVVYDSIEMWPMPKEVSSMEEGEEDEPEVVYDSTEMWPMPEEVSSMEGISYQDPEYIYNGENEENYEEPEVIFDGEDAIAPLGGEEYVGGYGGRGGRRATFGWRIAGSGECTWPGPTIRMNRGKTYGLFVRGSGNEDTVTNIHTHGLHVPGHGNADDVTRSVKGMDVIIYEYHIPSYHMGGTHWYHAHWHHNSEKHVGGGAFGMLIVEDGSNVGDGVDAGVDAFLKNEKIFIASNHEDVWGSFIVNGVEEGIEAYNFRTDEWYRLRILTVNLDDHSSSRTVSFGEECETYAIAHDGIFRFEVPAPEAQKDFSIGDASRLDVAIRCAFDSAISINGQKVATIKAGPPLKKSVVPSPFKSSIEGESWSSTRPEYLADLRGITHYQSFSFKVDETNINGQQYSLNDPFCPGGGDVEYGSIFEWEMNLAYHPLHLHIYPMQVVSENNECGDNHEYGEFYDTITLNNEQGRKHCKVRIAFVDVGGKTLMQCHVFKHGDQGAMLFFNVVGGPQQPDEPRVHKCASGLCDEPVTIAKCKDEESLNA